LSSAPERAFVALGSNLGDRRAQLDGALRALRATRGVRVVAASDWVETEPVGGPPRQGPYLNGVVELETTLEPRALLARLLEIERAAGRVRVAGVRDAPRTLDLDLLLHGERRVEEPDLLVPHPRMEERVFVLQPLAQLAPQRRLPGCRLTVRERLEQLLAPARA
jgi:2-amino-4-hydroxy-6-hydroxymethyldihydropteridine diphosphokinase